MLDLEIQGVPHILELCMYGLAAEVRRRYSASLLFYFDTVEEEDVRGRFKGLDKDVGDFVGIDSLMCALRKSQYLMFLMEHIIKGI